MTEPWLDQALKDSAYRSVDTFAFVIISKIINSNDIFYQNNCFAPTGDEINDREDSHEIFNIDGDHFFLLLWTIKNQESFT